MKIKDIARAIEEFAPASLAESYDNVGLLVGDPNAEATGVLINLDVTEELIDEAVAAGINMIVTHHPIWFTGIKRLIGDNYVSRIILKAIRENVALYACHTNLDNVQDGVNRMIGERMGIENMRILSTKREQLLKLVFYGHAEELAILSDAVFAAGARDLRTTDVGRQGRVECIMPTYRKGAILNALRAAHLGQELVYHVLPTLDTDSETGSGMIGMLPEAISKPDFLAMVKERFGCGAIRYADAGIEKVQRVAWCGGAGSFLISNAISAGADAFITGDITYHKFFDSEGRILLLDIGHFESEQFTSNLLHSYLSETFPTFAVRLSRIVTNPVKYC
ncbi:MAG: Nif3-like dinuclear metal center hexameric protein [Bacteroidetes bacterium]|nr:Nif3-like dinuclear metal center hexameric protein [Bacteroidota bacterium]